MPDPIRKISMADFGDLLERAALRRKIDSVHLHHTWRPRHADFRGLATIEAMRRFHMEEQGWSDIAQHLTVDPTGGLWTGRNWNVPPASAKGHNGTSAQGPFMIEMVGDFDLGEDPFENPQRAAVIEVAARLLRRFLPQLEAPAMATAVRFHNEFTKLKTCPGTAILPDPLRNDIWQEFNRLGPAPPVSALPPFFAADLLVGAAVTRAPQRQPAEEDGEIPETLAAAEAIDRIARQGTAERQRLASASRRSDIDVPGVGGRGALDFPRLAGHVIHLSGGQLATGGEFDTSADDLRRILAGIREKTQAGGVARVVFYAHGGLNSARGALEYADGFLPWWRAHGIYPIFFVWETGFLRSLRDAARADIDGVLEVVAKPLATLSWSGMKKNARLASSPDAGDGNSGGAFIFAHELASFLADPTLPKNVELHAVGHSAGAVFFAHFLPLAIRLGMKFETLALMAPAVRTQVFKEQLQPLVGTGKGIAKLATFIMDEQAERADSVAGIYRKSLLYFVSRACEGFGREPILGLEESLRKDPSLRQFLESAPAELHLSHSPDQEPNPLTQALQHGKFDQDPFTMSAILRRVLGRAPLPAGVDEGSLGVEGFPETRGDEAGDSAPARPLGAPAVGSSRPLAGRRRALCVGIDSYRTKPLTGCVNDAKAWGGALRGLDFDVDYLFETRATRDGILNGLRSLIGGARPGDVIAFQYSGHGTQVKDPGFDESDAYDEALVPFDYESGALLIDDDLGEVLRTLPEGIALTLFMDCCHCGTNSRFAPPLPARGLAAGDERDRFLPLDSELERAHREFRRGRRSAAVPEEALPGVIHLAACLDDELAYERNGGGIFTGVASQALVQAARGGSTNEDFLRSVRQKVAQDGRQHPMILKPALGMAFRRLLAPLGA